MLGNGALNDVPAQYAGQIGSIHFFLLNLHQIPFFDPILYQ